MGMGINLMSCTSGSRYGPNIELLSETLDEAARYAPKMTLYAPHPSQQHFRSPDRELRKKNDRYIAPRYRALLDRDIEVI